MEEFLISIVILVDFLLDYFHFAPSLIASLIALGTVSVKRALFFNEPVRELAVSYLTSAVWLTINVSIIHLIITKVGFIYTEAEVLRKGNDQILNNLNEGVIILDQEDLQIKFQNRAAQACKSNRRADI